MNNYLLSIDPSIKNTGFTLWEKQWYQNDIKSYPTDFIWKPIFVKSYSFKNYKGKRSFYWAIKAGNDELDLIIERGTFHSKNGIGYETQEHLRGFIAGQFNKLLKKDMLISPRTWQNWYLNQENIIDTLIYNENEKIGIANHPNNKWNKDLSIKIVNYLTIINNWNITISNHDEADSLLIGWYYLNKENK